MASGVWLKEKPCLSLNGGFVLAIESVEKVLHRFLAVGVNARELGQSPANEGQVCVVSEWQCHGCSGVG